MKTTDLVERVAIALEREFDRVVAECNGDPDFRAAARAAIAAYESALQARVEKLEGLLRRAQPFVAGCAEFMPFEDVQPVAVEIDAALADGGPHE